MVRVTCHDYGHDCDFEIEGVIDEVIEKQIRQLQEQYFTIGIHSLLAIEVDIL